MEAKKTIRETIESWVKDQSDDDLYDYVIEELYDDYRFEFIRHIDVQEHLRFRVEMMMGNVDGMMDVINEAMSMPKGVEYIDYEGKPWYKDDAIDELRGWYLDEVADKVMSDLDMSGQPEESCLDTDELFRLLIECPEWLEEYAPDYEEDFGPDWKREIFKEITL